MTRRITMGHVNSYCSFTSCRFSKRAMVFTLDALVAAFLVLLGTVLILQNIKVTQQSSVELTTLTDSSLQMLKMTGGLDAAVASNASLLATLAAIPSPACANITIHNSAGTVLTTAQNGCASTGTPIRITSSAATFFANGALYQARMVVWYS